MGLRAWVVLLGVCVSVGTGCSRAVPVMNPGPMAAAGSADATQGAILDALPKKRWTAEQVTDGRIVAFLPIKSYLVRVEIVYDERQVRIAYLSSDNLGEQQGANGEVYAHANVNKWLRVLALTIARSLGNGGSAVAVSGVNEPAPGFETQDPPAAPLLGSALTAEGEKPETTAVPLAPVPVAPR